MKRAAAIIGLFALVSQFALGNAGALFLCLCEEAFAHDAPCAPATLDRSEIDACAHEAEGFETPTLTAASAHECSDVLLQAGEVKSLSRVGELHKIKSPPMDRVAAMIAPLAPATAVAARPVPPARVDPGPHRAATRTIRLLI